MSPSFTLLSWNTAHRTGCLDKQAAFLAGRQADLVALQEVTVWTLKHWKQALPAMGLPYLLDSFQLVDNTGLLAGPRRYGEIIAGRWPLQALPSAAMPWPERPLSALIDSPWGPIELHTTHIPCGASHGMLKIETFEGIYNYLAHPADRPRILCGDLNAPQLERPDGQVVTWGQDVGPDGNARQAPGSNHWDRGERCVLEGLAAWDLADVFRAVNGPAAEAYSWYLWRKGRYIARRRFDHLFAGRSLGATACRYLQEARENRWSDHAAIEGVFELG